MATYTTNYNLEKPEASDPFGDFRQSYNDNLDIIDANLGGGGGSGGHTILDPDGNALPQEDDLQFTGAVSVTDDNVNGKTIVDILGGGGNVYGAFVDTNREIASGTYTGTLSYIATEDCFVAVDIANNANTGTSISIDGKLVNSHYQTGVTLDTTFLVPLGKGQTLSVTGGNSWGCSYHVYGILQGTNGIFAPVIYSDNERVIGVWRDNKPLYAKTFPFNISSVNNWTLFDDSVSYENLISAQGFVVFANGEVHPFESHSDLVPRWIVKTDHKAYYYTNVAREGYVTLIYTKTTDVAGSGNWNTDGVPTHHYSTNEQVVGTYFGKPLYEKTWDNVSIALNGTNWVYFNDPVDIDNVISFDAYYNNSDRYLHCAISEFQRSNSNGIMFSGFSGMNRTVNRITAQYTKTTD